MLMREAALSTIAHRACSLLECSGVALTLACPPFACHPLLNLFVEQWDVRPCYSYARSDLTAFVAHEAVQQLIVDAIRTRSMQVQNDGRIHEHKMPFASILVVPLERSAGIVGVLVCVDAHPDRFLQGEQTLLTQIMPTLAHAVEQMLWDNVMESSHQSISEQEEVATHSSVTKTMQEQQTLVSLVSHDLRMPLTAIRGYAGLLQAYGPTEAAPSSQDGLPLELQRHYLSVIMEQTHHMEVLINDLLDVSRIQRGQLALHCTWVNLTLLCRRVVQLLQDKTDLQEVGRYCIRCRFDAPTMLVWADPNRVQQVLTNLIENAVKYSPDGGLIEVQVRNSATAPVVTVRDWGMGIPTKQQAALFRVFKRGEQVAQRNIAGLGLGLYIVRTLVEAMNGSLTLRSSEGHGTSVSFILPRKPVHAGECVYDETYNQREIASGLF